MGVGVSYIGVDGKITSFDSESVADAMDRLSTIRGYSKQPIDDVAINLASAWKKRSSRKASNSISNSPSMLQTGLKKMDIVTNIKQRDGNLFVTKQSGYMTKSGEYIPTGSSTETRIKEENSDNKSRENL